MIYIYRKPGQNGQRAVVAATSAIRSGVTFRFDLSYSITKEAHVLNGRIRPIAWQSDCVCPAWRMSNLVL